MSTPEQPETARAEAERLREHLAERKRHCGWCRGKGFVWQNYDDYGIADPKKVPCTLCAETDRILGALLAEREAKPSARWKASDATVVEPWKPVKVGSSTYFQCPRCLCARVTEWCPPPCNTQSLAFKHMEG